METIPLKCKDINGVASFCDCIAGAQYDPAAREFCNRVKAGDRSVTADELAELKKALKDLES